METPRPIDSRQALEFERPIIELEQKIAELKLLGGVALEGEIRQLERKARRLQEEVFHELSAWQKVQLSRHPLRPFTSDYIGRLFEDWIELHGDRAFGDDEAIIGGLGSMGGVPVVVLGHQKGRGTKENVRRNFGMPRPEGYRKARRLMELGERFKRPILTFIDTPGAFPGIDAEERGQAEAIAKNLEVMARLKVPIIAVVIGEGGSGGALALGVADRILMLEYAIYSVISPEGCASILWKDQKLVEMTATDLKTLGIADEVIGEPPGGAHRDPAAAARAVEAAITRHLAELMAASPADLLERRYQKYRDMGAFVE
jgi:acetyl-CoA carboxylase carboxyl transferase subunit alpha